MDITTWYLEMLSPEGLSPAPPPPRPHWVEHQLWPTPQLARQLYCDVGGAWQWTDRLAWSESAWGRHVARSAIYLQTLHVEGSLAGYAELEREPRGNVSLAYFGLLPAFFGQGFGGYLLTRALQLAWSLPDTRRVHVHTCTLDAPEALANYRKRGFVIHKTERRPSPLPCNDPQALQPEVERKLLALFDCTTERASARELLLSYGRESYEQEAARVRLAILHIAGRSLNELKALTAAAKTDFREVLLRAEYPSR